MNTGLQSRLEGSTVAGASRADRLAAGSAAAENFASSYTEAYQGTKAMQRDGQFADAQAAFAAIVAADPHDAVCAVHLARAQEWRNRPQQD